MCSFTLFSPSGPESITDDSFLQTAMIFFNVGIIYQQGEVKILCMWYISIDYIELDMHSSL